MDATNIESFADSVIATLRAHEAELRAAGIKRLSSFGSVARGEATEASDIDLAAELEPEAHIGLIRLGALERRRKRCWDLSRRHDIRSVRGKWHRPGCRRALP